MKQLKLTFLLTILMSMVGGKALANDIEVKNADGVTIYYNYINNGLELEVVGLENRSYRGVVVIPDEVTYMNRTRKVTSIGEKVFQDCAYLTSITIPNSVTTVGNEAFINCSGLTSVTIPKSVMSIGESAFERCKALKKVIIKDIAAWCGVKMGNCYSTPLFYAKHLYSDENTEVKDLVIPNNVTKIGDYAFDACSGLTSVTIPNSVTSIGDYAFASCI